MTRLHYRWIMLFVVLNIFWVTGVLAKSPATFAYLSEGLTDIKDERQIGIQLWAEELSRSSSVQFEVLPVDSLPKLMQLIQTQKVDFLLISSFYFLQEQSKLAAYLGNDVWAIQRAKKLYESFVIFTRQDFKFSNLASLRHQRLSLRGDYLLMNEYLRLLTYQTAKLEPERFFKKMKSTQSVSLSVLDVFFSSADVGITPQFAYDLAMDLNPSMLSKLKIVHTSPEQFIPALVLSFKHTPVEIQAIFKNSMLNMQTTPRGKQIIELFKINSIQAISFRELQPLIDFYQQVQQVTAPKKHAR